MAIQFTYDPKRGILFTEATGLVSFEDIEKHIDQEKVAGALAYPEIFDASNASTNITPHQIRLLVKRIQKELTTGRFGPTAVVAVDDVFFGMARMFEILMEVNNGPLVAVFRKFDEALGWIISLRDA